jgi:hypothetical protein
MIFHVKLLLYKCYMMIFHVKLLLYECYMMICHVKLLLYECYMMIFHVKLLLYECFAWLLYGVIYAVIICCVWIMLNSTYWYSGKMSIWCGSWKSWCVQPRFIHQTLAHQRGGQRRCLAEKNVLNCFKDPLFCSFWMTNIFFGGGQLLGDSLMVSPYTIHNSKKHWSWVSILCLYIHLQQNNHHRHKSMWRGGEDDGESWWWMMMGCHRQTKINDQKAFDLISHCHIIYKRYICGP